jgi:hypothetical protein
MADIEATLSPRAEGSLLSLGKVAPRLEPGVFRYGPVAFRRRTRLITGLCLPKVADRQCTLSPRKKSSPWLGRSSQFSTVWLFDKMSVFILGPLAAARASA